MASYNCLTEGCCRPAFCHPQPLAMRDCPASLRDVGSHQTAKGLVQEAERMPGCHRSISFSFAELHTISRSGFPTSSIPPGQQKYFFCFLAQPHKAMTNYSLWPSDYNPREKPCHSLLPWTKLPLAWARLARLCLLAILAIKWQHLAMPGSEGKGVINTSTTTTSPWTKIKDPLDRSHYKSCSAVVLQPHFPCLLSSLAPCLLCHLTTARGAGAGYPQQHANLFSPWAITVNWETLLSRSTSN